MELDCKALGVRIGLEVHQQLNTGKLFCSCPSEIIDSSPDLVVNRRLRASAGETGRVDSAAEYEMKREKRFIYNSYRESTCAVELDEEPIHWMNHDALMAVLECSKLMGCRIVDRIIVMRKTVVDGSNTSGFQRTALVAAGGHLDTGGGQIPIQTVCIEEESAKIVESTPDFVVYNLSRMGMPLIELATGPDIREPEQAREVAEMIGMILRSTGRVKRGIGTIRQDLNVSIERGARVEIKGAQDLRMLPKLAEIEIRRQAHLAGISDELKRRRARVHEGVTDITGILKETGSEKLQKILKDGGVALALRLEGFAGLIRTEIQPGRRLGKEFSEHARRAAGVGGAIHSDELPKHGVTLQEVEKIRERVSCKGDDAFIFVVSEREKAEKAVQAIIQRATQAIHGVPVEVRKANPDGTTHFLRPMPGSARMYPETDARPVTPDTRSIRLPELLTEKAARYEKAGLCRELAQQISRSEFAGEFEAYMSRYRNIEPAFMATTILKTAKELKTRYGLEVHVDKDDFGIIFEKLSRGGIAKETIIEIFAEKAKGKSTGEAISQFKQISDSELEGKIKEIISANKELPVNALVGKAMEKLRGRAEGRKIVEMVKRLSQQ